MNKNKEFLDDMESLLSDRDDITLEDIISVKKSYQKSKHGEHLNGFKSSNSFASWYLEQFIRQNGNCCYCETPQRELRILIDNGLLKTRTVGRNGSGRRGYRFEVERMDTEHNFYTAENCMLSCYYCNNDKSYIFPAKDYKIYLAESKRLISI